MEGGRDGDKEGGRGKEREREKQGDPCSKISAH